MKLFSGSKRQRRILRVIIAVIIFLAMIASLWGVAVYSDIGFIAKWRAIYIETAMSTMNHQWLATAFIPQSVIDEVMDERSAVLEAGLVEETKLPQATAAPTPEPEAEESEAQALCRIFPDIDPDTVPEDMIKGEAEKFKRKDMESVGVLTLCGDAVWAIDAVNGILIVSVSGDGYAGKLAIVNDSSKVFLGVTQLTESGQKITELCEAYDAVLGVNASGFDDPEGMGLGAKEDAQGLVISEGVILQDTLTDGYFQIGGYDAENNFRIGYGLNISELRDAAQFYPAIILNGENVTTGDSYGFGIQPRTVIGQTADKRTLLLVIDGRQVGYSVGTTVVECAAVLMRYGCYNALCMDGGSSSAMAYDGELITSPSAHMENGRYIPNAWLVGKS
ncbi:MAG: phosphodiester glycosidase family protein [Oscillospiraceae bacterium]|nr:phosphodiester glycosidase family protein [Oscillospiraceae bacterium]